MYRDKEHEAKCQVGIGEAVLLLVPASVKDLRVLDEFLYYLDISHECIDIQSVHTSVLEDYLNSGKCGVDFEELIVKELKQRFEDADGHEDNKRYF